jgi:hypothetical protein
MEIKHYTLDAGSKLNYLHMYEFPFTDNYKGFGNRRINAVTGPATVFTSPKDKVTVITTQVLNSENFRVLKSMRIIDRMEIVDYDEKFDIREIEKLVLGKCGVEGCNEVALFEGSYPDGAEEGHHSYVCSPEHMEKLSGSKFCDKRKPLEELGREGKVEITVG